MAESVVDRVGEGLLRALNDEDAITSYEMRPGGLGILARAAIAAHLAALAEGGLVISPKEPTDEMLRAGGERSGWTGMAGPAWKAMLDAAPAIDGGEAGAQERRSE